MSKKREIEVYEDNLPTEKEELQKELLKYKRKDKERKENKKNKVQIILLLLLIGIIGIAIFIQTPNEAVLEEKGQVSNMPLEQYRNSNDGYYSEQYKSASERYGTKPIEINKNITKNGIKMNIKQIVFLQDKTIVAVEVVNHNNQSVHLMLPQQSYLRDNYGRRYEIDPFKSDSNLNSTLPGLSRDYTNLVFEKVNEDAKTLTYSANIGGLMGTPAWEQEITFEIK
jgi:hypothetical protein